MTLKLKPTSKSPSPFSWNTLAPSTPPRSPAPDLTSLPSPPTSWLSARDMKIYGAQPLRSDIGVVRCNDCDKPILKSAAAEHAKNCYDIRIGKKAVKGKVSDVEGKKRKAEDEPEDPSQPNKKKAKPATKVTKGRFKGPVDYDKQCGVINDKNLPCSRSLTCKSHSMGAKRAVQGRSKAYDELLLEWNRANNPNWVEPVKKETKAEKKEKRDKEKAEKKRLAMEAAAAAGIDLSKTVGPKKVGKKAAAAAAAVAAATRLAEGDDGTENLDDIDSEVEVDAMVKSVQNARLKGIIGVPLAVPCDAGSWFVARRERLRNCRDLLAGALMPNGRTGIAGGVTTGARLT
ncbi:hypothetical protein SERLA73DRAFT_184605 [Serpula lacrymans var. lacrymans S7.3]|uniref:SCA7 domain-containing protein n=2 Tax=Serpula lacrymans var. lacrymans TaxID=341189 RepID=F8Q4Q2_SERL3|nr:uncharacterized protein SERLADRAFT_472377 [Serpula lacrymans var. lacrymans S7.9]EGN96529.1 hypothetical protein SERLA73DRAFT_184605 [Serpula lacrymans var. lacrymans S7.3]EGO22073.1 hypothetical protein SERLADRAFT_472377 [Serpula lacrymans var. lacrymans S7.9]